MRVLVSFRVKASPLFVVFPKTQAQAEYKKIYHFFPGQQCFKKLRSVDHNIMQDLRNTTS